ncbi:MAG: DUF4357 domain-containing protein [Chloroflexi bacterium]|nr:DUF4357 domain-containing protein [Chloroflexota bacterium]
MAIENRNLKPGTKLVAKYRKHEYNCEVVAGEGEKILYRLEDGREFKSPSAAGMAITGKACNGWAFWRVKTEAAPATPEAATDTQAAQAPATPEPSEPAPAQANIFKLPNQKGVPEGQTKWHCRDCAGTFLAPSGEKPEKCPYQHQS